MAFIGTLFTNAPRDPSSPVRWKLPAISKPTLKLPSFLRKDKTETIPQAHKTAELKQTDHRLMVAAASFGLTTSGLLFSVPTASFASIPLTLYAFMPVFKCAAHALHKEKKVNDQVLIATRAVTAIVVGYTFIASIDALLQSTTQRTFAYKRAGFRQTLPALMDNNAADIPAPFKAQLLGQPADQLQQFSEQRGQRIAPWMLASFALTIPLLGVGHAAAFLTTTFGANLRYLGPYTAQRFMLEALRRNILILQPDALRRLTQVDTLVVDAGLLKTAAWQALAKPVLHGLGRRNINIISSDLLPEALDVGTACYIGRQNQHENPVPESALCIAWCQTTEIKWLLDSNIVLLGDDLSHLPALFRLADAYVASQKFNQIAPDRLDVADVGTTLLLRFGLLYSLAFTYSGLLVGTAYADYTLDKYRRAEKAVD